MDTPSTSLDTLTTWKPKKWTCPLSNTRNEKSMFKPFRDLASVGGLTWICFEGSRVLQLDIKSGTVAFVQQCRIPQNDSVETKHGDHSWDLGVPMGTLFKTTRCYGTKTSWSYSKVLWCVHPPKSSTCRSLHQINCYWWLLIPQLISKNNMAKSFALTHFDTQVRSHQSWCCW